MGLQKLILAAGIAALLMLEGCTGIKPVAPGLHAEVDARAVALARLAVQALAPASYAFYPRDGFTIDTVRPGMVYSDSALRLINLFGFINCRKATGPACDYPDTVRNTPDTQQVYVLQPLDYKTGFKSGGFSFDDYLMLLQDYTPAYYTVALDAPEAFREFQSLYGVVYEYFGSFLGSYTPDAFAALKEALTFYPVQSPYDSAEVTLESRGAPLMDDSLPAAGVVRKNYYLNSDSAGARYGLPLDNSPAVSVLHRYVWFSLKGPGGTTADTVADSYHFINADSLLLVRMQGRLSAFSRNDTVVRGSALPDSTYAYAFNSGYTLKFGGLDSGPVPLSVTKGLNDTVFGIAPSGGGDSLIVTAAGAVVAGFQRLGATLNHTAVDSQSAFTSTVFARLPNVYISFSRRETGASGDSFSGWISVNLYSRRGAGYLLDRSKGFRYQVSVDLDRSSSLSGIGL
jgi:hypothetical protein